MTPKREKYLAKCSKQELILRHWIKVGKGNINRYKFGLNYDKTFTDDDIKYCLSSIRFHKDRINCYRHELQRLKGVDRVVVPREVTIPSNTDLRQGYCICGRDVYDALDSYCPTCGRKILWEKVK